MKRSSGNNKPIAQVVNLASRTQYSEIWWVFLLQGLAGIVLGIMLFTEPAATVVALTTLLGFYRLIAGVLALVPVFWIAPLPGFGRCSNL